LGVLADHFGGELALVHQGDLNLVCVTRHVIVGQDIPVGRNDDARADPVFLEVMRDLTEKVPELFERIAPAGATATTERITRSKWTAAPATAASGTRTWLVLPAAGAIFVPLAGSTGFDFLGDRDIDHCRHHLLDHRRPRGHRNRALPRLIR